MPPRTPKPSVAARVLLASRSICGFAGCANSVYDSQNSVVTGQIAHICAHSPGGARYDKNQTAEERRDFPNLWMLCTLHHRLVDGDEETWSTARLREMKREHEETVPTTARVIGPSDLSSLVGQLLESTANSLAEPDWERHLRRQEQDSATRCLKRWLATGLDVRTAWELLGDESVGASTDELSALTETQSLTVLVGEMGLGKSLIAERILQSTTRDFDVENPSRPLPLFVDARFLHEPITEVIERSLSGANPSSALIVVDGLDEVPSLAPEILNSARAISVSTPRYRFLLTSRSMPYLFLDGRRVDGCVDLAPLDDEDFLALVDRVSSVENHSGAWDHWPKAVRDLLHRPLFAVLLGLSLRSSPAFRSAPSPWQLLGSMIEQALGPLIGAGSNEMYEELVRLGVALTEAGRPVSERDFAPDMRKRALLLSSRFVTSHDGHVDFSLAALTTWFAAQGLFRDDPLTAGILQDSQRLVRWFDAFCLSVSVGPTTTVKAILSGVVSKAPHLVSELVKHVAETPERSEEATASGSEEARTSEVGADLRDAMVVWSQSLPGLAPLLTPFRDDKSVRPLGVHYGGSSVSYSWNQSDLPLDSVVHLAKTDYTDPQQGWSFIRGRPLALSPGWQYELSFDALRDDLTTLLNERALPAVGFLEAEQTWTFARLVTGVGPYGERTIPLEAVEASVHQLLEQLPRNAELRTWGHTVHRADLEMLGNACARLRSSGEQVFQAPWPGPDQPRTGFTWSGYSTGQYCTLIETVVREALGVYRLWAHQFFAPLAPGLRLMQASPVRFVGKYEGAQNSFGPTMLWYWEPVPTYGGEGISIEPVRPRGLLNRDEIDRLAKLYDEMNRPSQLLSVHHGSVSDFAGAMPVQELAYEWLWSDLSAIGWVSGSLRLTI